MRGRLGKHLLKRLLAEENYHVVGTDHREEAPERGEGGQGKATYHFYKVDLLHKDLEKVFQNHPLDAVIHLDLIHNPREDWTRRNAYNLSGTVQVVNLCEKFGVKKFIFLSSANLYGPSPRNSQLLKEESPLLAQAHSDGPDDLVKTDLLVQSFFWKFPQLSLVILRPCHIVGPLENGISHYLRMNPALTLLGYNPMIQLIHLDDLLEALVLSLRHPLRGVFNIRGPGEIALKRFLEGVGKEYYSLPSLLIRPLLSSLWNSSLSGFPPYEMFYLKYPCMVDDSLFRQKTHFRPKVSYPSLMEWVTRAGF